MLKYIKKSLEQKTSHLTDELLKKGMSLLEGKLYKQSMIEFKKAFQLDQNATFVRLNKEFKHYLEIMEHEAALSVGLVLISVKKNDYELANIVGNCARRQKNYQQANNLYRHSLRNNKNYEPAFYNLAASMGKVEKYDMDVKRSLEVFKNINDYILPHYEENPDFIDRCIKELTEKKELDKIERIDKLKEKISQMEANQEFQNTKLLAHDLQKLERVSCTPTTKEFYDYYLQTIANNDNNEPDSDSENRHSKLYNIGLYGVAQKDSDMALKCFQKLKDENIKFKYLEMLIAIASAISGKPKQAIKTFVENLGNEQYNRFFNINLGLMYSKIGNRLLATKYLIIGAELLEKSDGLYHLSDLIEIANQRLAEGHFKAALKLYKVAVSEIDNIDIWLRIGEIYINLKQYDDAVKAYREIQRIDPESIRAQQQLEELHNVFRLKAEDFFNHAKYQAAVNMYEKALKILRLPETIKQTASVYKVLKNPEKTEALTKEYEEYLKKEKEKEDEQKRLDIIKKGKIFLKSKKHKMAIEQLEIAFRMKLDKNVFVLLASLYKAMKRKADMENLLQRWNKMVEYQEKLKKFEKQEERAQTEI